MSDKSYEQDLNDFLDEEAEKDVTEEGAEDTPEAPKKPEAPAKKPRGRAAAKKDAEAAISPSFDVDDAPVRPKSAASAKGIYMPPPMHATKRGTYRLPSGLKVTNA